VNCAGTFERKSELISRLRLANQVHQMSNNASITDRHRIPLRVAIAVAVFGFLGLLIVDHGPWNKPKVQTAATAIYTTTGEAARAASARVEPTDPKPAIEPVPPGPKPVHPANPPAPR
jgi:hypothetical protein